MDRYRGRGCVCFVHCSDQAGGKLSVRVFTSDQTALTNPSSKKHLVRSHKVWNVFEALLQPLSLSLFLCMLSMSLAPVNGQPLSAKHTEKKEKSSWPPKRFTVSVFVVVFVSVALPRDDNTIPVWLAQRERERLALYTFRNRNLRYENSNVRRVFCVVSLKYSVASQDGCLHELRCKSVSVPAATSPTWAEKEYSSKSKHGVEILLWQNYLSKSQVTGNKRYIHIFLIVGIGVFYF